MSGAVTKLARATTGSGRFAASAFVMGACALASAHLLIGAVGASSWSNAVVAQALGAIAGAICSLGWTSAGPSLVAMNRPCATRVLAQSVRPRAAAVVVAVPITVAAVFIMTRTTDPVLASLSIASMVPSLGCSWYFIGMGEPWKLLKFDVLPQAAGLMAGSVMAIQARVMLPFAICTAIGAVFAVTLSYASAFGVPPRCRVTGRFRHEDGREVPPVDPATLRNALSASWAGLLTSYSPLLLTAALVPGQLPVVAMADRLFRFALAAFSPVLQVIQGWVPRAASPSGVAARARTAVGMAATWGLIGGALGFPLLSDAGRLLSLGVIVIPVSVAAVYACMYFVLSIGQVTALACLVPLGESRTLAHSTVLGALIVLALGPLCGSLFGLDGILLAVLLAEVCAVASQVLRVLGDGANVTGGVRGHPWASRGDVRASR